MQVGDSAGQWVANLLMVDLFQEHPLQEPGDDKGGGDDRAEAGEEGGVN